MRATTICSTTIAITLQKRPLYSLLVPRFQTVRYALVVTCCYYYDGSTSSLITVIVDIKSLPNDFLNTPFGVMLKPIIDSFYGRAAQPLPTAAVVPPVPAEPKQQPPHTHPAPVAIPSVKHPHLAMALPNIGYSQLVLFDKCVHPFSGSHVVLLTGC